DPTAHRPMAARFGQDNRVTALSYGSIVVWLLGYPEAALDDAERAVKYARELGQAAALMYAPFHTSLTTICSGRHDAANARLNELGGLAKDKNAALWMAWEMSLRGWLFSLTGRPADAVETHHFCIDRTTINWRDGTYSVDLVIFDESLCKPRPIR